MTGYIVGVFTLPAIFAVGWLTAAAMERGMEIACACGYFTGRMKQTRRIVMWTRWRWHRLTVRHPRAKEAS